MVFKVKKCIKGRDFPEYSKLELPIFYNMFYIVKPFAVHTACTVCITHREQSNWHNGRKQQIIIKHHGHWLISTNCIFQFDKMANGTHWKWREHKWGTFCRLNICRNNQVNRHIFKRCNKYFRCKCRNSFFFSLHEKNQAHKNQPISVCILSHDGDPYLALYFHFWGFESTGANRKYTF